MICLRKQKNTVDLSETDMNSEVYDHVTPGYIALFTRKGLWQYITSNRQKVGAKAG